MVKSKSRRNRNTRKRKLRIHRGGNILNNRCFFRRRTKCSSSNLGVFSKKDQPCEYTDVDIGNCKIREHHENDLETGKCVTVLEDQLKIVRPDQWICFGSAVTSCFTMTVVMTDNWKIACHIQPASFQLMEYDLSISPEKPYSSFTPYQYCNPKTILPEFKNILMNNPNFKLNKIKYIHIATAQGSIFFYQKSVTPKYTKTNIYTESAVLNDFSIEGHTKFELNDQNKMSFFSTMFPTKLISSTKIFLEKNLYVQGYRKGYIFILEDGTLEYRNNDAYTNTSNPPQQFAASPIEIRR